MKIIESVSEMREYSQKLKKNGRTVGYVGTDSFLHDGHMSLVKIAKENFDVVLLDICHSDNYANCSPKEYEKRLGIYKKTTLEKDKEICVLNKVDVLFIPSMEKLFLDTPALDYSMVKAEHPTFPSGCLKYISAFHSMFKISMPDAILLGEKDLYQNVALKSLINRLGLPIKVVIAPTARDPDGLAFSSRNAFLTKVQRERALSVYKSLQEVAELTSYPPVKELRRKIFNNIKNAHGSVCHIDVACAETMAPLDVIDRRAVVVASATFDKVTVWDNILIND